MFLVVNQPQPSRNQLEPTANSKTPPLLSRKGIRKLEHIRRKRERDRERERERDGEGSKEIQDDIKSFLQ